MLVNSRTMDAFEKQFCAACLKRSDTQPFCQSEATMLLKQSMTGTDTSCVSDPTRNVAIKPIIRAYSTKL